MLELKTEPAAPAREATIELPLISFIVSNYNYGRFLARCVGSIFDQTYPNIECIVVDDASTDESRAILARLQTTYPSMRVVLNAQNLGQTRACLEGFALSGGPYVALVDADDYLLPGYARAHIATHMRMRAPIGFSSCDMLECVGDEIVWSSSVDGGLVGRATYPLGKEALRKVPKEIRPALGRCDHKLRRVRADNTWWVWGPTTSSVYRRDALTLFADNPRIGRLKFATDAYFNFAINALCGSVVIDKAFAVYHIHPSNNFSTGALLGGIRQFHSEKDYGSFAAYCALEHIVCNFGLFARRCYTLPDLLRAMTTLARKARESRRSLVIGESIYRWYLRTRWSRRLRSLLPYRR